MSPARGWAVGAAACLVGFVVLALTVTTSPLVGSFDLTVQHAVLALRASWLTPLMQTVTTLGSLPFVVGTAVSGVLLLARLTRGWRDPLVLALTVGLGAATTALVKLAVARPRPGAEDRIGPPALDHAFPSGHTGDGSLAWCAATLLVCRLLPRSRGRTAALLGALVLSVGIGLSRVYLGYHWPSDVVGAWLLAAAFTCAAACVGRSAVRTSVRS